MTRSNYVCINMGTRAQFRSDCSSVASTVQVMGDLVNKIIEQHNYVFYDLADPRSSKWFLMGSPWPIVFLAAFYVYFVTRLGPRLMKNREPFNIDGIIKIYDLFQIAANFYIITEVYKGKSGQLLITFFCEPIDYTEKGIKEASMVWFYFMLKVVDLLDTVFFVLRKKNSQITFLHVYHHWIMVVVIWMTAKYYPGGHGSFLGYINCYVHMIMYLYYFITNTWPHYKKNLWWKKYVTIIQMVQFSLILLQQVPLLFISCPYPMGLIYLSITQNVFMLKMFYDFYVKTYVKNKVK
ncbi:hypothetical protein L9F63_024148 [Diploptera punctata]|uniref:Elongation of very long chain fatty acids protein n=1 Tax=Diploptera punctata TaxID=6984 RepID=A0AAD7ZHT6_DIPPU|nr:hypothetical protein L9F63_024148 [Diploptera punctata]